MGVLESRAHRLICAVKAILSSVAYFLDANALFHGGT